MAHAHAIHQLVSQLSKQAQTIQTRTHAALTSSDRGVLASLGVASCHIRDTPLLKARASTRGAHGGVHGFSPNPNRRVLAQPPACAASAPSRREP